MHARFLRRVITFLGVAPFASRDQVRPRVAATAGAGRNMINGEIFVSAAVLAFPTIALEYILPGKINALVRGVHITI